MIQSGLPHIDVGGGGRKKKGLGRVAGDGVASSLARLGQLA